MPVGKSSRLANRLRVLDLWAGNPTWGASKIGREAGGVHEATVRSIIKVFGPVFKQGEVSEAPKDAPRSGRPETRKKRWIRYDFFGDFWMQIFLVTL